jgi:periplasmic protein TonB
MIALNTSNSRELMRWALCAVLAVAGHVGVAAAFANWDAADDDDAPSGAIVMELAVLPVARADVPLDIPPGPDQVQSEAARKAQEVKQVEKEEDQSAPSAAETSVLHLARAEAPEAVLPEPEKPREQVNEDTQTRLPAPVTSAAQAFSDKQGAVAQAPVQAAPKAFLSDAVPKWRHRLEMVLERNKRYPSEAQRRNEQGEALVSFVIDKQGKLVSSSIVRGSGYAALDQEALDLLQRSSPFPPPPDGLPGGSVKIEAPVRFNLR